MAVYLFIATIILMYVLVEAGGYTTSNWELWVITLMMVSTSKNIMESLP